MYRPILQINFLNKYTNLAQLVENKISCFVNNINNENKNCVAYLVIEITNNSTISPRVDREKVLNFGLNAFNHYYQFTKPMSVLKSVFVQKQSVIKENRYSSVNIAKSTLGPKDEISFFNKIGALKGFRRKDEYVQKRPYCLGGEGEGLQHSTWFIRRAL